MDLPGELELGRKAYGLRAWGDAFESLARADRATGLEVEDLERLAIAAYMTGREREYLDALERAHRVCLEAGDEIRASRCAFWIGLRLLLKGEPGPATGWLARARRLLDQGDHDCVERGFLLLPVSEQELRTGDHEKAHATARSAVEIGERFSDPDLIAAARHVQGRALIAQGGVEAGLALLDETMVAVTAGEVSPLLAGLVYCSVIDACQEVCAFARARDWTNALADWCDRQPQMVAFTSTCLVHRAEVMQRHGAWAEAIEEAMRAREPFSRGIEPRPPASAYYQQAEVHRLRGEFSAAERAYRSASEWGRDPQPGLALLRLAQGRADQAAGAIHRVLGATADPLRRAKVLPATVEVLLAAGRIDEARDASRELDGIAETFDTEALEAMAAGARGAVELADGDPRRALDSLRRAWELWQRLEAPYLAARVRVEMGAACRALGDEDGARLELRAARAELERLGAEPDLVRLDPLLRERPERKPHGLTPRELQVLRMVAAGMTNRRIAAELTLSEKTVDRHVSNILHKLGVPSRVAATAYAYEHELIERA